MGGSKLKIITLLGSARKKGNTATVLGWVEEELRSLGHDVERIYLNNKSMGGCQGCAKCRENADEIVCIQNDDVIAIMEQMILSEVILFASPIYFWGFSSQIKTVIDRGYSLVTNYHKPGHTSLLEGKRIGLLVTGGGAYKDNAEAMFTAFDRIVDFFLAKKSGELYVGECSEPAALSGEFKKKAQKFARSMVEGVETV